MPDVTLKDGTILRFPDSATEEQQQRYIAKNYPDQAPQGFGSRVLQDVGQYARGAARGAVGLGTSAADVGNYLVGGVMNDPVGTQQALSRAEQPARDWATDPNVSGIESAGRLTTQILPFLAQPELGLARGAVMSGYTGWLPRLAELAEDTWWGAGAGAAQPTKSGTLESHLSDAGYGALAGAAPGALGAGIQSRVGQWIGRRSAIVGQHAAVTQALHLFGVPWVQSALGPFVLWNLIHNNPITKLAGRAAKSAGNLSRYVRPGGTGAVAGQLGSRYDDPDAPAQPQQQPAQPQQQNQQQQPDPSTWHRPLRPDDAPGLQLQQPDRPEDFKWLPSR